MPHGVQAMFADGIDTISNLNEIEVCMPAEIYAGRKFNSVHALLNNVY